MELNQTMKLNSPVAITKEHIINNFDCGVTSLNNWLSKKSLRNATKGFTQTFVVSTSNNLVVGYYSTAMGTIKRQNIPKTLQRNAPNEIPIAILCRLAVDINHSGQGLGEAMLVNAIERIENVSAQIGCAAILVHYLDGMDKFYRQYGFIDIGIENTLFLQINSVN
jgi:ribosomal protein S18 acetylase RimI-like enzyme